MEKSAFLARLHQYTRAPKMKIIQQKQQREKRFFSHRPYTYAVATIRKVYFNECRAATSSAKAKEGEKETEKKSEKSFLVDAFRFWFCCFICMQ